MFSIDVMMTKPFTKEEYMLFRKTLDKSFTTVCEGSKVLKLYVEERKNHTIFIRTEKIIRVRTPNKRLHQILESGFVTNLLGLGGLIGKFKDYIKTISIDQLKQRAGLIKSYQNSSFTGTEVSSPTWTRKVIWEGNEDLVTRTAYLNKDKDQLMYSCEETSPEEEYMNDQEITLHEGVWYPAPFDGYQDPISGIFNFVVQVDGRIYIGQEFHTNLARGDRARSAGNVVFDDGVCRGWNHNSGHFRPLELGKQFGPFDAEQFLDIDDDHKIKLQQRADSVMIKNSDWDTLVEDFGDGSPIHMRETAKFSFNAYEIFRIGLFENGIIYDYDEEILGYETMYKELQEQTKSQIPYGLQINEWGPFKVSLYHMM